MSFEIGQRVVFRSLQWEVQDNSSESVLTLFGRDGENQGKRARVVLALGETIERAEVPPLTWTVGERHWDPLQWRALHHAFRLTLSHGRSNLASVDWGRLILEPYQLVPLQKIERLPFPRLLIADDTGLGKTAEAGLILFRLLQKRRADRILVLCRARPEPERWRDELKAKFGIDLTVINDGDDYAKLRREVPSHLNVFGHVSRIAMSMYYAAPSKRSTHVVDDLSRVRWDVVIVDEAHHLAERGDSTKRLTELGRVVADTSEALLLLTATPHDGKAESFASLLRLIDPYLVVDPDKLEPSLVRPLLVRRLKSRVVRGDGTRFLRRKITVAEVERSREENWLDKGLRGYCKQLRERAKDLKKAGERSRAMGASFLESFLRRRLASSVHACRESLTRRLDKLEGKPVAAPTPDQLEDRDESAVHVDQVELPGGKVELEVVRDLVKRAERIPEGHDAKLKKLLDLLTRILRSPDEKAIIFTEFVDTLEILAKALTAEGYHERLPNDEESPAEIGKGLFYRYEGGTPRKSRELIRRRFLEDKDVRLLVATDAASESINLHKGCNNLIHLESVWNPNRYEQRNGRIDRYGQTRPPQVYLLLNKKSIDEEVAKRGYEKLEEIADALGSVSNVLPIANKIDVDDLLERFDEDEDAAAKELADQLDKAARAARADDEKEGTADILRGDSFEDDERRSVEAELATSRGFVPEFKDVEEFLNVFLRAEGGQIEPVAGQPDVFSITVPARLQAELETTKIARGTFRRDIAVGEEDSEEERRVEFLSPGHPLVRAALRRARGWIYNRETFKSRASYRRVGRTTKAGFVFTYAARFLDGRGEGIEERFEAVFVGLDGSASTDPTADMARFLDPGIRGNPTEAEERALKKSFAPVFPAASEAGRREAERRAQARAVELADSQRGIAEEALMRLGLWRDASDKRIQAKAGPDTRRLGPVQLDLMGEVAAELAKERRERDRRLKSFRDAQERLLADETQRRHEIRAMEHVRLDTLEAIGALALLPEGLS